METVIHVAMKAIIVYNSKVLTIQRSDDDPIGPGTWEFAGGKMRFGEEPEEALLREVFEETGLRVSVVKPLYAASFFANEHRQTVILTYLCRADSAAVTVSEEHKGYAWADRARLRELLVADIQADLDRFGIWDMLFPDDGE